MTKSSFNLLAALAVSCAAVTRADNLGVKIDDLTIEYSNGQYTLGWSFDVAQPITVTGLGVFDSGKDGLSVPLAVGLWDSGGTLLASTTVPAGTAGTLANWFRFEDIAPLNLPIGSYVVGAESLDELYTWDPASFVVGPDVTFTGDRFVSGGGLAFPVEGSGGVSGWFGGNFTYAGVPEASPLAPALAILAGGVLLARRRQVSVKA
jgi:hypothetical protein